MMLILNFFGMMGFRGIGNTFGGVSVFGRIMGWREIRPSCVTDCFGHTGRSNFREEFTVPWICWRLWWPIFQIGVASWWNKGKKGVACSNILWMMSESFSSDDVLDSCVVWQCEINLEIKRRIYLSCYEGSWLNWKATQRVCDQVKHAP